MATRRWYLVYLIGTGTCVIPVLLVLVYRVQSGLRIRKDIETF